MRLLMLSIDVSIADPQSQAHRRVVGQAALAGEAWILVLKKAKESEISAGNVKIFSSPHQDKFRSLLWAYKKALSLGRADVITAQDPFALGCLARRLAKKLHAGVELQLHGDFFSTTHWRNESGMNKIFYNIGLGNIKKADAVRAVSARIKNDLVGKGIAAEKITVVPVFVAWQEMRDSAVKFSLKQKYSQFDFLVLSLGRLERVKHIDLLINAFAEFLKDQPKAGLIIVGEGREKIALQNLVNKLKIEKSVIFEPKTVDPASYYRGADCFVLCSWYEGWGRTVIEAMACGCPIIMTDVGCVGEAVMDGESVIVIGIDDRAAFVGAIVKMKISPELRKFLVDNAFKRLEGLLSQEETARLYLKSWELAKNNAKRI